jgi:hypothetical protein
MLAAAIVMTALLLAALGLRAERNSRAAEIWVCNAVAAILLGCTVAAHAGGLIA